MVILINEDITDTKMRYRPQKLADLIFKLILFMNSDLFMIKWLGIEGCKLQVYNGVEEIIKLKFGAIY